MSKTAVVLFNLGGPDSPAAIHPFLINFFMDRNIIPLPYPLRWLIACRIAARRTKNEAGTSYGLLGGKSPLLENTRAQADALQTALGDEYRVFISMRYWHPMADETVRDVMAYAPDRIMLLPLYPQYSTTTTNSSFEDWDRAAKKAGLSVPTAQVCCYPLDRGFIDASAALVREAYDRAAAETGQRPRVLFSAHGLPEKIIKSGDPYQHQCEESASAIAAAAGLSKEDWIICYQSRVGPMKWIGPSTEEALHQAAQDKVPVVIYPHAFVSEHVETLVEIEMEYRHLADEMGVPYFKRVPTVSIASLFIDGLARLVKDGIQTQAPRFCPKKFCRCAREKQG